VKDPTRKTWIVIADGGHARILLNLHRDEGVTELPLVSADEPRLAAHHSELAAGVHHTPTFKPTSEKRAENHFLDVLAETIQTGVGRKEYDQLVLVAPATALGHLRNALSPATRKHVVAELVHDYIHQNNDFVMEKVREKLPL
jgi:protein required for attachment to host cells